MLPLNANSNVNLNGPKPLSQKQAFSMFGNTFVGEVGQSKSQFKASNGMTAADHSRQGVLAHENAHDSEAKAAGLSTSGPILETKDGLTVAGHVNLEVPQFDKRRAAVDSGYLSDFKRKSQGLVNSATAPEHAGIGGYGHMSSADSHVAEVGRSNVSMANSFNAQAEQAKMQSTQVKTQAKNVSANFGYHPDLLNAFNSGTIG